MRNSEVLDKVKTCTAHYQQLRDAVAGQSKVVRDHPLVKRAMNLQHQSVELVRELAARAQAEIEAEKLEGEIDGEKE